MPPFADGPPPPIFPTPAIIRPADAELLRYGGDPVAAMLPGMAPVVAGKSPAFPAVAATNIFSNSSSTTTHNVNLPSGIAAGNLLIVLIGGTTGDRTIATPSTWNELFFDIQSAGNGSSVKGIYKNASGSEGSTVAVTFNSAAETTAVAFRITGHQGVPEVAVNYGGSANDPDPPSLTPSWGSAKTLWIAASLIRGNDLATGYPTNYTANQITSGNGNGDTVATAATRELEASSENPDAFTQTVDTKGWGVTIAVRPA